jgi:hypothetical protein
MATVAGRTRLAETPDLVVPVPVPAPATAAAPASHPRRYQRWQRVASGIDLGIGIGIGIGENEPVRWCECDVDGESTHRRRGDLVIRLGGFEPSRAVSLHGDDVDHCDDGEAP